MRNTVIVLLLAALGIQVGLFIYKARTRETLQEALDPALGGQRNTMLQKLMMPGTVEKLPTAQENPKLGDHILRGIVWSAEGQPAAGISVAVEPRPANPRDRLQRVETRYRWTATTGTDGSFEFTTLKEGHYVLQALGAGQQAVQEIVLSTRPGASEVFLHLEPGRPVNGAVTGPDGLPAPEVSVFALLEGAASQPYALLPAKTEKTGRFLLNAVPATPLYLLAVPASGAMTLSEPLGPEASDVKIVLGTGQQDRGVLMLSGSRQPVANAKVALREKRFGFEYFETRTGNEGNFHFEQLRPAEYAVVLLTNRHYLEAEVYFDLREQEPLVPALTEVVEDPLTGSETLVEKPALEVQPVDPANVQRALGIGKEVFVHTAASLRGRVLGAQTGQGIGEVTVIARASGLAPVSATSDQGGYYRLEGIRPGEVAVHIELPQGFVCTTPLPVMQAVAGSTQVDGPTFTLTGAVPVLGRVVDAQQAAVPYASVFVEDAASGSLLESVASGADGAFAFSRLPAKTRVRVWGEKLGHSSAVYGGLDLGETGLQGLALVVDRSSLASIQGVVVDSTGAGVAGAQVHVYHSADRVGQVHQDEFDVTTDEMGVFTVERLIPDTYRLVAGRSADRLIQESAIFVTIDGIEQVKDAAINLP
ncbi:MAG: carboxypeptidase regulatory-like domain-containing protein [Candidatus Hydrogenedentes bacterium]|nr:carboxypeptidase regulatory-like domain-containing protein [Candidatus Hydrogenedentota bacterium]